MSWSRPVAAVCSGVRTRSSQRSGDCGVCSVSGQCEVGSNGALHAGRHAQSLFLEPFDGLRNGSQTAKGRKYQFDRLNNRLIGIQHDLFRVRVDEPDGQREDEFPAERLVALAAK